MTGHSIAGKVFNCSGKGFYNHYPVIILLLGDAGNVERGIGDLGNVERGRQRDACSNIGGCQRPMGIIKIQEWVHYDIGRSLQHRYMLQT